MNQTTLAMNVTDLAKTLDVSPRHCWKMLATGRLPKPVRLGRAARWSRAEIESWLASGAPSLEQWEALKSGAKS